MICLPHQAEIDPAYQALTKYACWSMAEADGMDAWNEAYARSMDALVRASRELTIRARETRGAFASLTLTDDFVVVPCDPNLGVEGEELLARTVDEPLRSRLFP